MNARAARRASSKPATASRHAHVHPPSREELRRQVEQQQREIERLRKQVAERDQQIAEAEKQIADTERPTSAFPLDWSADGRFVLLREGPDGQTGLVILPVTADGKVQDGVAARTYLSKPFNRRRGRFFPAPNPRWLAY